jgi:hypothetical protein
MKSMKIKLPSLNRRPKVYKTTRSHLIYST